MRAAFADHRADRGRRDHDLGGQDETAADARKQRLRDDALQRQRELRADLDLPIIGEHVDDAVDRARARVGVQGGQCQMPGFRQRQGRLDRIDVAHLSDQDHVGILPEDPAERAPEGRRVDLDLALLDATQLVGVHVLDGILDRDDVLGRCLVDQIDHRRQRRRFAAAGWTRDQHQPPRPERQLRRMGGKTEFLERRNRARQHAQRERQVTALVIERTTKARESFDLEREVSVPRLFQLADSRLAGERTRQLIHRVARRDGRFFDRNEYPGDAHAGQTVRCDEQVGRTLVERDVDQARDVPREPCGRCHPAPNFIRTVDFLATRKVAIWLEPRNCGESSQNRSSLRQEGRPVSDFPRG